MDRYNDDLRSAIRKNFNTQSKFAKAAGCSSAKVSNVVRGWKKLPEETKDLWAKLLKTPKEKLWRRRNVIQPEADI